MLLVTCEEKFLFIFFTNLFTWNDSGSIGHGRSGWAVGELAGLDARNGDDGDFFEFIVLMLLLMEQRCVRLRLSARSVLDGPARVWRLLDELGQARGTTSTRADRWQMILAQREDAPPSVAAASAGRHGRRRRHEPPQLGPKRPVIGRALPFLANVRFSFSILFSFLQNNSSRRTLSVRYVISASSSFQLQAIVTARSPLCSLLLATRHSRSRPTARSPATTKLLSSSDDGLLSLRQQPPSSVSSPDDAAVFTASIRAARDPPLGALCQKKKETSLYIIA